MNKESIQEDIMHPRKKSRDSGPQSNNTDHFSKLHESILSNILSRLPTKEVVQTSILSKQWRDNWICLNHMDIKDFESETLYDTESFGNFVDKIVCFPHNLKSLYLSCRGAYGLCRIITWVCKILRCENIGKVELELSCWSSSSFEDKCILLPHSLLDKSSSKYLKLAIPCCTFGVGMMNSLSNLTIFHLSDIQILNGNLESDTLTLNFPVLEILQMTRCKWVNVKFVKIYAPVLNTFTSETSDFNGPNDHSIEIIGLMLSTFKSCGGFPDKVILTGSQVVTVSLDNYYYDAQTLTHLIDMGLQVSSILSRSSILNELEVSSDVACGLSLGPSRLQYGRLTRLRLLDPSHTSELFAFISKSPLLNFLHVNTLNWDHVDYELYPSCIKSHLEEVHLYCFQGEASEYRFLKFLLKNCGALKELRVQYHPRWSEEERDRLKYKLSRFPRLSTCVRIVTFPDLPDLQVDDLCILVT